MTLIRIVLIGFLFGSGSYLYFDHLKNLRDAQRHDRNLKAQLAQAVAKGEAIDLVSQSPAPLDKGMIGFPSGYRPSVSPWESAEKARYRSLFPAGAFDVLVVPFQVNGFALDRSTRSLMFAQLCLAIRETGVKVPDPYLVLRALGESRRQFNDEEIYEFAHQIGVKRIIWPYAGHDRKNAMSFDFRVKDATPNENFHVPYAPGLKRFESVAFSSESPPIVAYQALLPQIVAKLGYKPAERPLRQASRFDGALLPSTPRAMADGTTDPAADAFYFLTYAALTPASAQRARERYVEKAFLATQKLAEDSPDYRYLRARIFMGMGFRPAAVRTLGQGPTDEEKALLATLNGNLPEAAAATRRLKPKLKRLLAELDLAQISEEYGIQNSARTTAAVNSLALQGKAWPLFVARSISDGDPWAQFDNLPVKNLLDAEFPVQGFTAEGMISGAVTVSDPMKLRTALDFSAHDHVTKVLEKQGAKWCCVTDPSHPSVHDYLDLVDAVSFDNLARRVHFLDTIQGRPQDALGELARYESVYKGHPYFSLLRARAENNLAARESDAAREGLMRSAYVSAFDAWYNAQGQTADGADAMRLIFSMSRNDFGQIFNVFVGDVPFRSSYPTWEYGNPDLAAKNARAALDNATFDTQPVHETIFNIGAGPGTDTKIDDFLNSLGDRYHGNPDLSALRGEIKSKLGDLKSAEAYYREGISSQPEGWAPYSALALLLFRDGRLEESAKIAKRWPGFAPGSATNHVEIASHAYEIGSNYYWNGSFDLAKPFYDIAANLRTGSDASLVCESRIKLQAGDFAGAFKVMYDRTTRYGSPGAYRDYVSFLQAMGFSKASWDALNSLLPQQTEPYLWDSALVGHRIAAASDQEILAWASQDALRTAGEQASYAAMYVLRSATMDRMPAESIAAAVGQLDREIWKVTGKDGKEFIVRNSYDGLHHTHVRAPVSNGMDGMSHEFFKQSQKTRLKSEFELFATGYRMIRSGDYDGARARFEDAFSLYELVNRESGNYVLPYLALAAAKSNNASAIEKFFAGYGPGQQGFDFLLAKGVMLGLSGKTDDSIATLKKALLIRPTGETRPVASNYEYAEILEWLYQATGKTSYRDMALNWVRKNEWTVPWTAWPYAMDAKLSGAGPERGRAIAMAYYLDRHSERLKSIPKAEIEAAVRQFGPKNPFLNMKDSKEEKRI